MVYLPVFIRVSALVLQIYYLSRIVATNITVGIVDDAVLVVSAKQFQAALLYPFHLREIQIRFNNFQMTCQVQFSPNISQRKAD